MFQLWKRWKREPEVVHENSKPTKKRPLEDDTTEAGSDTRTAKRRKPSFQITAPSFCNEQDLNLLEAAKTTNTIGVFYDIQVCDWSISELFRWTSFEEMSHEDQKRPSLYIIRQEENTLSRCTTIRSMLPNLKVVLVAAMRDDSQWLELMRSDVVVLAASQLEESFLAGRLAFSQFALVVLEYPENGLEDQNLLSKPFSLFAATSREPKPRIFTYLIQNPGEIFRYSVKHAELEFMLSSNVFGVSKQVRQQVLQLLHRPDELVVRYEPPAKISDTALCKHLRSLDKGEEVFSKEFRSAKILLRELGSFASDWVWRRLLKAAADIDEETPIPHQTSQDSFAATRDNIHHKVLSTVKDWTFTMPNLDPASKGYNVTPKFTKLVQILQCYQHEQDSFRGVILVNRRLTAQGIAELLRTIGDRLPFIRPDILTGPGFEEGCSQISILEDFQHGICNLLVSTKFGESSVDIPPCSVVIRFDQCDSYISFAQTLALANRKESHVIFMQDRHADSSRQSLRRLARMSASTREWVGEFAAQDNSGYPSSPLTEEPDGQYSTSDEEDDSRANYLQDPTMSGRIYPRDALAVLYRYISFLKPLTDSTSLTSNVFDFTTTQDNGSVLYTCSVLFPDGAPLHVISGEASKSKREARQTACYTACKQLFDLGVLSHHFFPRPKAVIRRLRPISVFIDEEEEQTKGHIFPDLPPAPAPPSSSSTGPPSKPGQNLTGTRCYKRKKPEFWKIVSDIQSRRLYPTIVTVDRNHNPEKPYRPFLLLTRRPLPTMPEFKLYFSRGPSLVYMRPAMAFDIDIGHLQLLYHYTTRVLRAVSNKPCVCDFTEVPFFIAPLDFDWDISQGLKDAIWPFPDIKPHIPWDLVVFAGEMFLVPLRTESTQALQEDLRDAVIQDRWTEFTRRYDYIRLRTDLNPLTSLKDIEGMTKDHVEYENTFEWCKVNRKGLEGLLDYSQPLIEVSGLPANINRLQPATRTKTSEGPITFSTKFLIPELCFKFTIPASTMRTLALLPSIMKRVDEILLVRELNAMYFGNTINEETLQAAISAPSAGLEMDYERLELLGDAYLKYLSSIYLFVTNPTMHEGILHIARQKIISNRSLLVNSDKSGLPQYIQSKPFTAKLWLPQGYRVESLPAKVANVEESTDIEDPKDFHIKKMTEMSITSNPDSASAVEPGTQSSRQMVKRLTQDDDYQWLGDKCVADVAESIIGAAYQTGGRDLALRVVKSMHIPLPFIDSWEDFALKAKAPPPHSYAILEDGVVNTIEKIIGTNFKRPHILAQALTHTSVHGNEMTCYERLEFLGDAILDFLVVQHIFDLYGQLSPGALTMLKGAMVSNSALAAISVYYGLHKFLILDSESVKKAIDTYVPALEDKQQAEYKAASQEARLPGQYWLEVDPPKSIADVVESIMGAIYVSNGFQVEGAQAMYNTILRPFYDKHISLKTLSHHPTKVLFELFQSRGCQVFEITKQLEGDVVRCEVVVHEVILSVASDSNSNFAARRASFEALDALEGDPDFMTRICDCRHKAEQRKLAKRLAKTKGGKAETEQVAKGSEEDDGE